MHPDWIVPDWPAPANVHALMSTRSGGVSPPPFDSFNTASHVGDDPAAVAENRRLLRQWLPAEPLWLNQVHGCNVVSECGTEIPAADAGVAFEANAVRAILTADCLPVLFCDDGGTVVAAAHAGWRGLAGGVLEATVAAMQLPGSELLAWIGPAIGPAAFEVGDEVRAEFLTQSAAAAAAFVANARGRWQCDLFTLARQRLATLGVVVVHGGGVCTHDDPARFFSHRRSAPTGRHAALIWRT